MENDSAVARKTQGQKRQSGEPPYFLVPLRISQAGEIAKYRLQAFRQTQEQCQNNQHQVAHDQIRRQPSLPIAVMDDEKIMQERHRTNGEFHDERRKAVQEDQPDLPEAQRCPRKVEIPLF